MTSDSRTASADETKTFLFDDALGQSMYIECVDWPAAEQFARDNGLELIGEYIESQPGPLWLTEGETLQ